MKNSPKKDRTTLKVVALFIIFVITLSLGRIFTFKGAWGFRKTRADDVFGIIMGVISIIALVALLTLAVKYRAKKSK